MAMSCQGHWPIDSNVHLHHNLQKILWLRLVWAKLWGAMPGIDHLFSCVVRKAHKERGKEGPGETKPFSTQGLLIQRGCRCAAVAKNSVTLFSSFLLQLLEPRLPCSAALQYSHPVTRWNGRSPRSMTLASAHIQTFPHSCTFPSV